MSEDKLQRSGADLFERDICGCIHDEPRHVPHVILRAPCVSFQKLLQLLPRRRLVSARATAARLQSPAPLALVGGAALDDEEAGGEGVGKAAEAVEVRAAGERRVEEDAEAEAELRGGNLTDDVV